MVEQYKQLCTDSCSCVRNTRRLGRYKFDTPSKFGEAPKPPNEEQTAREAFAWEDTEDSVPEELARQVEDSSPRPQKSRRIQEPSSSVQPADHRPQTAPLPPLGLAPEPRAGSNGEGASNAYPESNNESDLERLGRMAILLREQADEMLRLADFAEYTMSQQILCPSGVQAALSQAAETRFCQVTQSLTRFVAASSSSSQFCQLSWQTPDNGRTMTGLVQSPGMGSAFNPALSPTPESNIDLPSCPTNEQGTRGDPELLSLWKKWAQDVAPSIPAAGPGSPWSATSDRATTPETEQDSDQQIFSWLESILTFATNN
ncbi:MAG: hypothetical protein M1833_003576 [Piccolia ochrophora]|nr:MAG: hypothetical protein M1833_003576 [Piccolia ochrophora]